MLSVSQRTLPDLQRQKAQSQVTVERGENESHEEILAAEMEQLDYEDPISIPDCTELQDDDTDDLLGIGLAAKHTFIDVSNWPEWDENNGQATSLRPNQNLQLNRHQQFARTAIVPSKSLPPMATTSVPKLAFFDLAQQLPPQSRGRLASTASTITISDNLSLDAFFEATSTSKQKVTMKPGSHEHERLIKDMMAELELGNSDDIVESTNVETSAQISSSDNSASSVPSRRPGARNRTPAAFGILYETSSEDDPQPGLASPQNVVANDKTTEQKLEFKVVQASTSKSGLGHEQRRQDLYTRYGLIDWHYPRSLPLDFPMNYVFKPKNPTRDGEQSREASATPKYYRMATSASSLRPISRSRLSTATKTTKSWPELGENNDYRKRATSASLVRSMSQIKQRLLQRQLQVSVQDDKTIEENQPQVAGSRRFAAITAGR